MEMETFLQKGERTGFVTVKPTCNPAGRSHHRSRIGRQNTQVVLVTRMVANHTDTDPEEIMGASRGTARVAQARQMVAYLLHTALSMSLSQIAEFFSRDRTTIGHACRLIEDMRDNSAFECIMTELEEIVCLIKELSNDEK